MTDKNTVDQSVVLEATPLEPPKNWYRHKLLGPTQIYWLNRPGRVVSTNQAVTTPPNDSDVFLFENH